MSTVTVRFRGICCFIDPKNGQKKYFNKRVVLPDGKAHSHGMETHLPIIEFYADDLDDRRALPKGMELKKFTRPGDDALYARVLLTEPVSINLFGVKPGTITSGANLVDSVIHLDSLVTKKVELKESLVGPVADVDSSLVAAVVDLPEGVLMSGPPEAGLTTFDPSLNFTAKRVGRWLEHIVPVDGPLCLELTPLGKPGASTKKIWFKTTTRLITIANEPLRLILGTFVPKADAAAALATSHGNGNGNGSAKKKKAAKNGKAAVTAHQGVQPANGGSVQTKAHFHLYWDLMANPPAVRPLPQPFQGTGPSCSPAIKP